MMPGFRPAWLAVAALAAVAAALAWLVAVQILYPSTPGVDGFGATALTPLEAKLLEPDEGPDLSPDLVGAVLERPVFSQSRQPAPGQDTGPAATVSRAERFDFDLKGVVVSGAQKVALVLPRGSRDTVQLNEGDTFQGWTVSEIGAGFVAFRAQNREQVVYLTYRPDAAGSQGE